ncbi:hypothetical protein ABFA07_022041 [Porites harrisoni]
MEWRTAQWMQTKLNAPGKFTSNAVNCFWRRYRKTKRFVVTRGYGLTVTRRKMKMDATRTSSIVMLNLLGELRKDLKIIAEEWSCKVIHQCLKIIVGLTKFDLLE